MEILGIGMPELIFVIIIALIILGPKDMQKAGRTIGKFLRNLITSDGWKIFQQTSRELRTLPNKLMREANDEMDKINKDIAKDLNPSPPASPSITPLRSQPYSAAPLQSKPARPVENSIAPTSQQPQESESDPTNNA